MQWETVNILPNPGDKHTWSSSGGLQNVMCELDPMGWEAVSEHTTREKKQRENFWKRLQGKKNGSTCIFKIDAVKDTHLL